MIVERKSGSDRDPDPTQATGVGVAPALVFLAVMIAATTTIAARATIVRAAPATAAAYASFGMPVNLRGLSIDSVRATIAGASDDRRELLVAGEIVNLRQAETPVPNLRIALSRRRRSGTLPLGGARAKASSRSSRTGRFPGAAGGASVRGSRRAGKIRRAGR